MVMRQHRKLRQMPDRWKIGIAFGIVIVVLAVILSGQQHKSAERLYENSLVACERGNIIRAVVYRNTESAVLQDRKVVGFKVSLNQLRSTPYINLKDGTVDCLAAIKKP